MVGPALLDRLPEEPHDVVRLRPEGPEPLDDVLVVPGGLEGHPLAQPLKVDVDALHVVQGVHEPDGESTVTYLRCLTEQKTL